MAPLAKDIMGVGEEAEQGLRVGDSGPMMLTTVGSVNSQAAGTLVGGPTGATLLEIKPSTTGNNCITFLGTTEIDREFSIWNVATVASTSVVSSALLNVYPPLGGNFQGLGANTAFQIGINKSATVSRLGRMPPVTGSIATDRWIYTLSA